MRTSWSPSETRRFALEIDGRLVERVENVSLDIAVGRDAWTCRRVGIGRRSPPCTVERSSLGRLYITSGVCLFEGRNLFKLGVLTLPGYGVGGSASGARVRGPTGLSLDPNFTPMSVLNPPCGSTRAVIAARRRRRSLELLSLVNLPDVEVVCRRCGF